MIVKINNHEFKIKTAITPKETMKGMMFKKFDGSFDGMLFLMKEDFNCFWMKNCVEFLDIIHIKNHEITKIHNNCPPCKTRDCKNYCGDGNLVLELPGLTCQKLGIVEGDLVDFVF